jgi:hypothetical protein
MLDSKSVLTDVWLPGEPRSYLSTSRRMMKRAVQETAMNYKTIILSLLRQNRREYQRLVQAKQLAPTLDLLAQELRERHRDYLTVLAEKDPTTPEVTHSQPAFELALAEIEERLKAGWSDPAAA